MTQEEMIAKFSAMMEDIDEIEKAAKDFPAEEIEKLLAVKAAVRHLVK